MKKLTGIFFSAIIFAIILTFACTAYVQTAVDGTISVTTSEVVNGIFTASVKISNNPGLAAYNLQLQFDNTNLRPVIGSFTSPEYITSLPASNMDFATVDNISSYTAVSAVGMTASGTNNNNNGIYFSIDFETINSNWTTTDLYITYNEGDIITQKFDEKYPVTLPATVTNVVSDGYIHIYSATALASIGTNANYPLNGKYKLEKDIDLGGKQSPWNAIGRGSNPFTGIFNGNGHTITGLYVNAQTNSNRFYGLFGYSTGTISDLCVVGDITVNGASALKVGGILAVNNGGTIQRCVSCVNIKLSGTNDMIYAGGIVASNILATGKIENCFNVGNVNAFSSIGDSYAGGIAAINDSASIISCYSIGNISSNSELGAIVAHDVNYAGIIDSSYYLAKSAGTSLMRGTSLEKIQMQRKKSFSGFNFDTVWELGSSLYYQYPILRTVKYDISLNSISLDISNIKTKYYVGDTINSTGLLVRANLSNNTSMLVTNYTISPLDSSTPGVKTVTVTHKGKTANYQVTVYQAPTITVSTPTATPGGSVTVNVSVSGNIAGFAGFNVTLAFDKTKITPVSAFKGAVIGANDLNTTLDTTSDFSTLSAVTFNSFSIENITDDGLLFGITFKLASGTALADIPLTFSYTQGNISDKYFSNINPSVTQGYISVENPSFIYGDINGDSDITIADAISFAQHLANPDTIILTPIQCLSADVFYDGKINISDAIKLKQYLASPTTIVLGPSK